MIITGYNSEKVTKEKTFYLKGITSLSVSNYTEAPIYVIVSNVTRVIPAYVPATNTLFGFDIEGDGTVSNIEITIGNSTGLPFDAILDYRKQLEC